jgi:ADP-heptose:LPS heptosyltransferase
MTKHQRRVLIFVLGGHADGLRSVPFIRAIRQAYPHSYLGVVAYQMSRHLWAACPYLDEFVPVAGEPILGSSWNDTLRKTGRVLGLVPRLLGRFDAAINLSVQPEGSYVGLLGVLAAVRVRVGYGNWRHGVTLSPGRVDMRVPYEDRAQGLLSLLGIDEVDLRLEAWCTTDDRKAVVSLLTESGWSPGQTLLVCHPGSDWSCQMWPSKQWGQLAETLVRTYRCAIAFSGTAGESPFVAEIKARAGDVIDLTGRTTYGQLAALLETADLVVSTDTLAAPLAGAMGTSVVTLPAYDTSNWSPSRLQELRAVVRFDTSSRRPWSVGCHWYRSGRIARCRSESCIGLHGMGRITVEDVLREIEAALAASAVSSAYVGSRR